MTIDRLTEVFNHQHGLMKRFHEIERTNIGRFDLYPNLLSYQGQARIRELASRVAIEVSEACRSRTVAEYLEETADILHFLVELFLACGLSVEDIVPKSRRADRLDLVFQDMIRTHKANLSQDPRLIWAPFCDALWNWCHQLKHKPWKRNPQETHLQNFLNSAPAVFQEFIRACIAFEITPSELYGAYFAKHRENQKRLTSKA
jgi:phosphoribosyl-ATP pyrophosphohydrolase